ncbi:protein disulfide oxidoreductase [Vibrio astriarenae]|nr:protein disulfide oxidoreductase [Vibrio astriarenae]
MNKRLGVMRFIKQTCLYLSLFIVVSTGVDWYRTSDGLQELPSALISQTIDGESVDLVEMSSDSPVIVYFWATWCSVCRFVSPSVSWLSDYYPTYAVALSSGSDARVQAFTQSHNYNFETINDTQGSWMKSWQISVTPTIYILHQGEIKSATTGFTSPIGILVRAWLS